MVFLFLLGTPTIGYCLSITKDGFQLYLHLVNCGWPGFFFSQITNRIFQRSKLSHSHWQTQGIYRTSLPRQQLAGGYHGDGPSIANQTDSRHGFESGDVAQRGGPLPVAVDDTGLQECTVKGEGVMVHHGTDAHPVQVSRLRDAVDHDVNKQRIGESDKGQAGKQVDCADSSSQSHVEKVAVSGKTRAYSAKFSSENWCGVHSCWS